VLLRTTLVCVVTTKRQQTPKPEAQEPLERPPRSRHSVSDKQVPLRFLPAPERLTVVAQAVLENVTTLKTDKTGRKSSE